MGVVDGADKGSSTALPFAPWEVVPAVVIAVAAAVLAWRALSSTPTYDIGLAYQGGIEAWRTGHPEQLHTWISTPFLAMVMGLASRVFSESGLAWTITWINLAAVGTVLAVVWTGLRRRPTIGRGFWWVTLGFAVAFAPIVSSLWWKQLNLVAVALAFFAFLAIRRSRPGIGGLLLALSLLVKPLAVLLPIALLFRRDTRRAALWTIGWGVAFLALSQAFLAQRAGDLATLNPFPAIDNFSQKSQPANVWVCHPENFSPQSMFCRIAGSEGFGYQRIAVIAGVLLLAGLANLVLRERPGRSWEVFSFALLLSPMVSPIAWSHYQLMLFPMFLLLAVQFHERRAPWMLWIVFGTALVLTELIWRPASSLPGALRMLLGGAPETTESSFRIMSGAMFAQYALYLGALLWFAIRDTPLARRRPILLRSAQTRENASGEHGEDSSADQSESRF